MEEMERLQNQLKELNESLSEKNLEEIGIIELKKIKGDYEALHASNLELQNRLVSGGYEPLEVRDALNLGETLWGEVGEALIPINDMLNKKVALVTAKIKARNEIFDSENIHTDLEKIEKDIEENSSKNLEVLNSLRETLRLTTEAMNVASDDAIKENYRNIIGVLNSQISDIEQINGNYVKTMDDTYIKYENKLEKLNSEIEVLRLGGSIGELNEINEETKGIDEEEERKLREEELEKKRKRSEAAKKAAETRKRRKEEAIAFEQKEKEERLQREEEERLKKEQENEMWKENNSDVIIPDDILPAVEEEEAKDVIPLPPISENPLETPIIEDNEKEDEIITPIGYEKPLEKENPTSILPISKPVRGVVKNTKVPNNKLLRNLLLITGSAILFLATLAARIGLSKDKVVDDSKSQTPPPVPPTEDTLPTPGTIEEKYNEVLEDLGIETPTPEVKMTETEKPQEEKEEQIKLSEGDVAVSEKGEETVSINDKGETYLDDQYIGTQNLEKDKDGNSIVTNENLNISEGKDGGKFIDNMDIDVPDELFDPNITPEEQERRDAQDQLDKEIADALKGMSIYDIYGDNTLEEENGRGL